MSSVRNTRYRIELVERAIVDLETIYGEIGAQDSPAAFAWYNDLEALIFSLDHLPDRGTRTEEDRKLRQLLHGNKPHIYQVIYKIDKAARRVIVLHIRHGARARFAPGELL